MHPKKGKKNNKVYKVGNHLDLMRSPVGVWVGIQDRKYEKKILREDFVFSRNMHHGCRCPCEQT